MTLRDATRDDYAAIARLMSYTHSFPADEEKLEEMDSQRSTEFPFLRMVAEVDGSVVGFCKSQWREIPRPKRYVLAVAVDPAYRQQGIGKALYNAAEAHAVASGAEFLWIQFIEDDEVAKGFAERRGYAEKFYLQDLSLDLPNFDKLPFAGIVEGVLASGIRFVPYSMLGDSSENRRKLYDLNVVIESDVPNFGQDDFMTYDIWVKKAFTAKWFDAAGQFIALDGDKWIGIGAVGEFYPGTYVNSLTGVLRQYRGRKIALALKLIGIEFARSRGVKELRTQNHGTNEAMRSINRRLGYDGLPGWYTYEKKA